MSIPSRRSPGSVYGARPAPRKHKGEISRTRSFTAGERLFEEAERLAVHADARQVRQRIFQIGLLARCRQVSVLGLGMLAHGIEVHASILSMRRTR